MTYGALTPSDLAHDLPAFHARSRVVVSQPVLCAIALTLSATVGLWMLYGPTGADQAGSAIAPVATAPALSAAKPRAFAALRAQARVAVLPAILPLRQYAQMLDPHFTSGRAPSTFAQSAPLRTSFEPLRHSAKAPAAPLVAQTLTAPKSSVLVASLPLPAIRPSLPLDGRPAQTAEPAPAQSLASLETNVDETSSAVPTTAPVTSALPLPLPIPRPAFPFAGRTSPRRLAQRQELAPAAPGVPQATATPTEQAESKPTFFDKFFGSTKPGNALAYAAPEDSGLIGTPGAPDRYTAVYNISTHTVTLPDGTRLEAHSGLGQHVDNPASVALRMRGATPPNLYDLTVRESPFHGVRALRLTPLGGTTYGRAGLLTHSYMLRGGLAESNGCVVFKNYPAFLAAYDRGQVRRLRVVAGI